MKTDTEAPRDRMAFGDGQIKILLLLTQSLALEGHAPSVRELAALYGCSSTFAMRAIQKLEKKGLVSRRDGVVTRVHVAGK